jgi:hypothetical protein
VLRSPRHVRTADKPDGDEAVGGARQDSAQAADVSTGELGSWKEIADYLKINVRTAQKWEQERGLPVGRLQGTKGRGPRVGKPGGTGPLAEGDDRQAGLVQQPPLLPRLFGHRHRHRGLGRSTPLTRGNTSRSPFCARYNTLMDMNARARARRVTVRRFASAAEADRHDLEYWRSIPASERLLHVWRLSVELWQWRGEFRDEPGLCRSVASVRRA